MLIPVMYTWRVSPSGWIVVTAATDGGKKCIPGSTVSALSELDVYE